MIYINLITFALAIYICLCASRERKVQEQVWIELGKLEQRVSKLEINK